MAMQSRLCRVGAAPSGLSVWGAKKIILIYTDLIKIMGFPIETR